MSTSRIKPELLRRMSIARILEVIHENGPCSRAEITRLTGISAPTVSKAVSDLLELGLLEEGTSPEGAVGRPGRRVQLASRNSEVFGVVLDATYCEVVAAGLDGVIDPDRTRRFKTPGIYSRLIQRVVDSIRDMRVADHLLGVGISIPGLLNRQSQQSLLSPNLHLTQGQRPSHDLADELQVETIGLQETHALCVAERLLGGARGLDEFAMLDIGTGLGLGVIADGKLLSGLNGLAGEIGHLTIDPVGRLCGCGNRGCLETLASETAFATEVSRQHGSPLEFDHIAQAVSDGELRVQDELNSTLEFIAVAMAAAINLYNPQTLFINSRLLEIQGGVFDQLVSLTRKRALGPSFDACQIQVSQITKRAGAVAGIVRHLTQSVGSRTDAV